MFRSNKSSLRAIGAAALLAGVCLSASAAQAAITVYTDQAAFLAALPGSTLEDFNDAVLAPGLAITSTVGTISGGLFNDQMVPGTQTTTFSFSSGQSGFGGIFDLSP